jgi:Snf7
LVRTRQHITKFIEMRSHLQGCALKLQTVKSHQAMAEAMGNTAKAMVRKIVVSILNILIVDDFPDWLLIISKLKITILSLG